jgi:hypothetical protein
MTRDPVRDDRSRARIHHRRFRSVGVEPRLSLGSFRPSNFRSSLAVNGQSLPQARQHQQITEAPSDIVVSRVTVPTA